MSTDFTARKFELAWSDASDFWAWIFPWLTIKTTGGIRERGSKNPRFKKIGWFPHFQLNQCQPSGDFTQHPGFLWNAFSMEVSGLQSHRFLRAVSSMAGWNHHMAITTQWPKKRPPGIVEATVVESVVIWSNGVLDGSNCDTYHLWPSLKVHELYIFLDIRVNTPVPTPYLWYS